MTLKDLTQSRPIRVWFAIVLLVAVVGEAFGVTVTMSTGAMLLAMSLVPLVIAMLLWPEAQSQTAGDVLRGVDRRD